VCRSWRTDRPNERKASRMRKRFPEWMLGVAVLCLAVVVACPVLAHFQMIVPSADIVGPDDDSSIALELLFTHPMEGHLMNMAKPVRFSVCIRGGVPKDLLKTLEEKKTDDNSTWTTTYRIKRPGDHVFFVEPAPYWEPAEDKFIIHYTKVVVSAMGLEEGWDHEVGLATEIVPLVRPYGLWAGNVFRGVVKLNGQPVPFAEIEVEYYNAPGTSPVEAPTETHVTQVIKADANGVFTYAMPRAGWWGFAALSDADFRIKGEDGKEHDVELGALMWVRTYPME